jgi:hypothetical protein
MSSPFLNFSEIFQKLKDVDLDKISQVASKVDLKDLLDRLGKMDQAQIDQVIAFIHSIPLD